MKKTNTEVENLLESIIGEADTDGCIFCDEIKRRAEHALKTLQSKDKKAEEMANEMYSLIVTTARANHHAPIPTELRAVAQKYGIDLNNDKKDICIECGSYEDVSGQQCVGCRVSY